MQIKVVLISILLIANLYSQTTIKEKTICDGITYKKIINLTDTLSINLLSIDFSRGNFSLRTVKANHLLNSKEPTSQMAKSISDSGYTVVAAINADFFEADGEIINNMISESEFVKAVKFTDSPFNNFVNTQFAVTDNNKFIFEQFVFKGQLILPGEACEPINRINSNADSNSITLYNSYQGDITPNDSNGWYIIEAALDIVKRNFDTLFCVVSDTFNHGGNYKIDSDFVLSANGRYAHYLERQIKVSDTLKIVLGFNPQLSNINSLVGGWPRLVKDGNNLIKSDPAIEGVMTRFSKAKHPRTGIGIMKDSSTVIFITVDGRQESSSGMTLSEFADLMIEEGIYQGLNLDGGGSTTMVLNNKIINNPSDQTGEREVGNCILLIKK
jgi:exopolysaccharide biosynthesis protein